MLSPPAELFLLCIHYRLPPDEPSYMSLLTWASSSLLASRRRAEGSPGLIDLYLTQGPSLHRYMAQEVKSVQSRSCSYHLPQSRIFHKPESPETQPSSSTSRSLSAALAISHFKIKSAAPWCWYLDVYRWCWGPPKRRYDLRDIKRSWSQDTAYVMSLFWSKFFSPLI